MMIHYVLLKLAPTADRAACEKRVRETYAALEEALPYLHDATVSVNCVDRDSNFDIMARIRLDGEECLTPYLTHPLHLAMAKDLGPQLAGKVSFDRH